MTYSQLPRRYVHTGLYSDKALKLVQDVVDVYTSMAYMPNRDPGYELAMNIRKFGMACKDACGEVVIAQCHRALYPECAASSTFSINYFENNVRHLSDGRILKMIARHAARVALRECDHVPTHKSSGICKFSDAQHLKKEEFSVSIDNSGMVDLTSQKVQITIEDRDLAFIIASFTDDRKALAKFPEEYVSEMEGQPRDPVECAARAAFLKERNAVVDAFIEETDSIYADYQRSLQAFTENALKLRSESLALAKDRALARVSDLESSLDAFSQSAS